MLCQWIFVSTNVFQLNTLISVQVVRPVSQVVNLRRALKHPIDILLLANTQILINNISVLVVRVHCEETGILVMSR